MTTRFGGRFVQSIDGVSGKGAGGRPRLVLLRKRAARVQGRRRLRALARRLRAVGLPRLAGDRMDIRAIVGAYPEPFRSGVEGKRCRCGSSAPTPARRRASGSSRRMSDAGIPASGAALGAAGNQKVIRVVVAPWERARRLPTVRAIEQGPRRSGVFARFTRWRDEARAARRRRKSGARGGPGTGLVAALAADRRPSSSGWSPGLDDAGVDRAAAALSTRDAA